MVVKTDLVFTMQQGKPLGNMETNVRRLSDGPFKSYPWSNIDARKASPPQSPTDHLFIGTDRFQYFTAIWNPETRQLDTVQSFVDVSEKHMRDSQSLDRCLVDPTGQYMVMELFEGVLNLVKVIKPRKGNTAYLDDPEQVRISELFVRSSTFLIHGV